MGTNLPITVASTFSASHSSENSCQCLRRHGQHHPLLGFRDPHFGVRQPFVLERNAVEPDFGADLFAHLADGAGKAAGAAIGDGVIQPAVARGQDHVEHHLLGDGVADLHGAARNALAFAGQFGRAERGAVNAVAARAPADGHDVVAGLRFFERFVARQAMPTLPQ